MERGGQSPRLDMAMKMTIIKFNVHIDAYACHLFLLYIYVCIYIYIYVCVCM